MQYFEPNFIGEALVLLDRFAPGGHLLAGGTLLGPALRARRIEPSAVINLKRIVELASVEHEGDRLRIGALATARTLAVHPLVRRYAPLLAQAAASVGAPQLRALATLGGNLHFGHAAADMATALVAYEAHAHVVDSSGQEQRLAILDLLRRTRGVDGKRLLASVEMPIAGAYASYLKMQTRRAFELPLVTAAVDLEMAGDVVKRARIALGGAAESPAPALAAQAALSGATLDSASARHAGGIAASTDASPLGDAAASADYRRHLAGVLVERALLAAARSSRAA
jgi:aerobic carbon-monoxide dehydrogenase medium subunit